MPTLTTVDYTKLPSTTEDSSTYVGFSLSDFFTAANESSDTDGFQIRSITSGALYVNTGTVGAPVYKQLIQGTSGTITSTTIAFDFAGYAAANSGASALAADGLTIRLTGIFIDNTKISGSDSKLYWSPVTANANGVISAFTIRAIDNGTDGVWNNGNDTISTTLSPLTNSADIPVRVNVIAVNDAPVNTVPSSPLAVTEDVPTAISGFSVSDVDAGSATMSVTLSATAGTFAATTGNGVSNGVTVTNSGTSAITLAGAQTAINAFISSNSVNYTTAHDANGTVTVTMLTNDGNTSGAQGTGGALTDSDTFTLSITAVNDAPVNTVPLTAQSTTGGVKAFTGGALAVSDVDAGTASMTTTLSVTPGDGTLTANANGGTANVVSSNGGATITITGAQTEINKALNSVVFTSTVGGNVVMTMLTNDNNTTGLQGTGGALTDSDTVTIGVPTAVASNTVPADHLYKAGDVLTFTVTFNAAVVVSGTPRLGLTIDSDGGHYANYTGISPDNKTLTFQYTVVSPEIDSNGIDIATSLDLNGGTASITTNAVPADTTLVTSGHLAGVQVDAYIPTPTLALHADTAALTSPPTPAYSTDNITSNGQIDISFGASDIVSWQYSTNGGTSFQPATTVTAGTTTAQFTLSPSVTPYSVVVRTTDAAGNTSTNSSTLTVTVDNTANQLSASLANDTFSANNPTGTGSDKITSVATVNVSGFDSDIAFWEYTLNGTAQTPTWTVGSGTTFNLANGVNADVQVRQTDKAGNVSPVRDLGQMTLDTTVNAPTVTLHDVGLSTGDGITNDDMIVIGGLEAGSFVQFNLDGAGFTTAVDSSGVTTYQVAAGSHTSLAVKVTDVAGNSNTTTITNFLIDKTAPTAAVITPPTDPAGPVGTVSNNTADGITKMNTFGVTLDTTGPGTTGLGIWEWASNYNASTPQTATWHLGTGTNTFAPTDGTYASGSIAVRETDVAGNSVISTYNTAITIDTVNPAVTLVNPLTGDDAINYTESLSNVTVSGTATAGTGGVTDVQLAFHSVGLTVWATTVTNATGAWSYSLSSAQIQSLGTGNHSVDVTAYDAAGNASSMVNHTFTIDLTPPPPSTPDLVADDDSGNSSSDDYTNVVTPHFSGTATATTTVELWDDTDHNGTLDVQLGTTTSDSLGAWTIQSTSLGEGDHYLFAKSVNGQVTSTSTGSLHVVIDTTAPTVAPTANLAQTVAVDTGVSQSDRITNANTLTFTGTGEAFAKIHVLDDNSDEVGTAVADASGAYTVDINASAVSDGLHTYSFVQEDRAGNLQTANPSTVDVTIDRTATFNFTGAHFDQDHGTLVLTGTDLTALSHGAEDTAIDPGGIDFSKLAWQFSPGHTHTFSADDFASIGGAWVVDDYTVILTLSEQGYFALVDEPDFGTGAEFMPLAHVQPQPVSPGGGTIGVTGNFAPDLFQIGSGAFVSNDVAGNHFTYTGADFTVTGTLDQIDVPMSYTLITDSGTYGSGDFESVLSNDTLGEDMQTTGLAFCFDTPEIDTTNPNQFSDLYVLGKAADLSIGLNFGDVDQDMQTLTLSVYAAPIDGNELENRPWINYSKFYLHATADITDDDIVFDSRDAGITFADDSAVILHYGFSNSMTLRGARGGDYLQAGDHGDRLLGNAGDDLLIGGHGSDALYGGSGNDTIFASDGNDYLSGGTGNDLFVFDGNGSGTKVISDFNSNQDRIVVTVPYDNWDIIQSGSDVLIQLWNGESNNPTETIRVLGQNSTWAVQCNTDFVSSINVSGHTIYSNAT